jgi:purine nucleosidase
MSLDVTHQALIRKSWLNELKALGRTASEAFVGLLSFYERYDEQKYGSDGGPLHDPTVIAYLLKPELFEGKFVNVEIETTPGLGFGQTVVDRWAVTGRQKNATWITKVDADGFFALILEAFRRLP